MASLLIHSNWHDERRGRGRQERPRFAHHHHHANSPTTSTTGYATPSSSAGSNHSLRYYGICYIAGGLSSSIRWVLAPLELIKMRMQVVVAQPAAAVETVAAASMMGTARSIVQQDGVRGLFRGLGPTAVAYWFQTSTKYGLYEVLKDQFTRLAVETTGQTQEEVLQRYQGWIYVAAAGTAEACADVLMSPAEMVKAHVQTSTEAGLTSGAALRTMVRNRAEYRFPFGALGPLWGRQIPGTVANFYVFENATQAIYQHVLQRPKCEYSAGQQLGVTFAAGAVAGVCSTVISHPADVLVSLMPQNRGKSVWQIAREVGPYRLATRGLLPRVLVTAKVVCCQWLLYDTFKSLMGLGTTGG